MSWRNVIIASPAKLMLKNHHLVIRKEDDIEIPLEDLNAIVVEEQQTVISTPLLDALAEFSVPLFICGTNHIPSGIFLSFQPHSRFLKVIRMQLVQTLPFKKNCWRLIVYRKIQNQAACLEMIGRKEALELRKIAEDVKSGDTTNRESYAARIYFDSFMPSTTRQEDNAVNASLNYGYALMRGAVARTLTAYGFLCAAGVHHTSELNQFNLADDFMEVLRPVVDLWTAQNIKEGMSFTIKDRRELVSLLSYEMRIEGIRQTVTRAIDIMCASYSTACSSGNPEKLKLPELCIS